MPFVERGAAGETGFVAGAYQGYSNRRASGWCSYTKAIATIT
jgi:hypothetical protein